MAFEVQKIDPLDLQPRKAVGVALPFSGKGVFTSTYQTRDAIRFNLLNFFLTGKGERYLNPMFGSNVRNLLFENIDNTTVTRVKREVERELKLYFPSVIPTEVRVESEPDNNVVYFYLKYYVDQTNIEDDLLITIE